MCYSLLICKKKDIKIENIFCVWDVTLFVPRDQFSHFSQIIMNINLTIQSTRKTGHEKRYNHWTLDSPCNLEYWFKQQWKQTRKQTQKAIHTPPGSRNASSLESYLIYSSWGLQQVIWMQIFGLAKLILFLYSFIQILESYLIISYLSNKKATVS